MTYRAKQSARMRRRVPRWLAEERIREYRRRNPFTLVAAQAILKKRYSGDPLLGWRYAYYGMMSCFFGEGSRGRGVVGALEALRIPDTLTARADFEGALYWWQRKLGPDPGDFVKARHAARPYA